MRRTGIFFICLALMSGTLFSGQKENIKAQVSELDQEFNLAKAAAFYLVIDLGSRKIDLKARGFVLREWQIRSARVWGRPAPTVPLTLVKKSSLFAPQRKKIVPGSAESTEQANPKLESSKKTEQGKPKESETFELQALELKDMPKSYELELEGSLGIEVRIPGRRFSDSVRATMNSLRWNVFYPLKSVWSSFKKRPFSTIEITLENERESEAFYWVLAEGQKAIIRVFPAS